MADFTTSYLGGPQGSPVTPLAPVEDRSSLIGLQFAENVAAGVSNFASDFAARKKEEQKLLLQQQNDETVSAFVQSQLSLVDATEMGDLSSAEARMRMRANLTRAIADNPALTIELGKAHTNLVKTTGLGQAVYEGTKQEQQQDRVITAALDAGWVTPDMSEGQKQVAAAAFQEFQQTIGMMDFEKKKVGLQTAQIGLTTAGIQQQSARLSLAEKQNKINSQSALGKASNAYMVKLSNDLERIRQMKEKGEIDATQAVMMVDQAYLVVDQVTRQVGSQAGSEYVNNIVSPMKQLTENYKGYMSGDIALKDLETRSATNVAQQTLNLTGNEKAARLVATSKLFPNSDVITMTEANDVVLGFIQGGADTQTKPADVLPDYAEGKQGLNTYLNMMSQTMGKVNNKTAVDVEATKEDVNNNLINILRGIDVYGPTTSSASDYNGVMDFLSRTEVGKYITTQGGLPDEAAAYKAGQAIEYQYANVVLPLVKEEWDKAKVMSYKVKPTLDYKNPQVTTKDLGSPGENIVPQFIGGGVIFNVKPGVTDTFVRNKAKELNDKVAPVLNRLIRTSAHLEGTMDYKSVYDSKYSQIFEVEDAGQNQEATP